MSDLSKGFIQTRGGGNENAVIRLTMNPLHSLIPFQLVLMCVFRTSCKSLSKARHLRDLLDKVVKVRSSEKHTATSCKKLAERVTCPDTRGFKGAGGECSECQVCALSLKRVCFKFCSQKLPQSFWA